MSRRSVGAPPSVAKKCVWRKTPECIRPNWILARESHPTLLAIGWLWHSILKMLYCLMQDFTGEHNNRAQTYLTYHHLSFWIIGKKEILGILWNHSLRLSGSRQKKFCLLLRCLVARHSAAQRGKGVSHPCFPDLFYPGVNIFIKKNPLISLS